MSFSWLFGIIIGAVILFLAIYAVTTMIGNEEELQGAKTSKEIGILLSPLETGFESSKTSSFTMPVETKIYNSCNDFGTFGRQLISVSQKNLGKWTETDIEVGFSNKYIFSPREVEGKKFFIFSKPFFFPYKVSDLIYMTSAEKDYCFISAPEEIKEELENLNQENIFNDRENFPEECIEICFSGNCDIKVDIGREKVEKNDQTLYFSGEALMYAAIFGDKQTYECTLKRLMLRAQELANLYDDKARLVQSNNCNSNLELVSFSNKLNLIENSEDLNLVVSDMEDLQNKNEAAICKLW